MNWYFIIIVWSFIYSLFESFIFIYFIQNYLLFFTLKEQ